MSSKKLSDHLKKLTRKIPKDEDSFVNGGNYVRNIYDKALRDIFGPLGIKVSDYLTKKSLEKRL